MSVLDDLLSDIGDCNICQKHLLHGVRPVLQVSASAQILIVGQAPGRKVHESGVPFEDASGDRLRQWMGVSRDVFYDAKQVAILPMGFCYPGTGKSGDLPPRPECQKAWRKPLLDQLLNVKLSLVLGRYAQAYHYPNEASTLTALVKSWRSYWPNSLPLPHPSPRNNIWLRKNPWFETDIVPVLQRRVATLIVPH